VPGFALSNIANIYIFVAAGLPYIACEQTTKKTPTVALAVVAAEQTS
jgi:hypothetical protein